MIAHNIYIKIIMITNNNIIIYIYIIAWTADSHLLKSSSFPPPGYFQKLVPLGSWSPGFSSPA
jgi:hypothetical protein